MEYYLQDVSRVPANIQRLTQCLMKLVTTGYDFSVREKLIEVILNTSLQNKPTNPTTKKQNQIPNKTKPTNLPLSKLKSGFF